jgi:hypothetical protein
MKALAEREPHHIATQNGKRRTEPPELVQRPQSIPRRHGPCPAHRGMHFDQILSLPESPIPPRPPCAGHSMPSLEGCRIVRILGRHSPEALPAASITSARVAGSDQPLDPLAASALVCSRSQRRRPEACSAHGLPAVGIAGTERRRTAIVGITCGNVPSVVPGWLVLESRRGSLLASAEGVSGAPPVQSRALTKMHRRSGCLGSPCELR